MPVGGSFEWEMRLVVIVGSVHLCGCWVRRPGGEALDGGHQGENFLGLNLIGSGEGGDLYLEYSDVLL